MLISISGLYGSGGNEMGHELAKLLNYTVHDSDLMGKVAEASGLDMRRSTFSFYDENDEAIDEKLSSPYTNAILSVQMDVLPIGMTEREQQEAERESKRSGLLEKYMDSMPINQREGTPIRQKDEIDRLRFAQAKVLLDAAEPGNSIFFGRCSSYILAGREDALRIFTYASMDSCCRRISKAYKLEDAAQTEEFVKRTNRRRAYYFETFTGLKWDALENYDYCINTDFLGLGETVQFVKQLVEAREKKIQAG